MSYCMDKFTIDAHTDTHKDAGNDNTRRPKLDLGKKKCFIIKCLWFIPFKYIFKYQSSPITNKIVLYTDLHLYVNPPWCNLNKNYHVQCHYTDVIMSPMASQITSLGIVYSTIYSGADQRKHQSSAWLAFVRRIHREPVNSPHKRPVTWKMFPFDDVIMVSCPFSMAYSHHHSIMNNEHQYDGYHIMTTMNSKHSCLCHWVRTHMPFTYTYIYIYYNYSIVRNLAALLNRNGPFEHVSAKILSYLYLKCHCGDKTI